MTTEVINIVVREDGSRVVKRNIEEVGGAAERAAKGGIDIFQKALAVLAAGSVINKLRELADTYTTIQNKLRLTTDSQSNLNAVFNELQNISTRTRSSLEANAELYSRISLSAKDLGVSQKEVLQFTESLNQAIKISGATSSEAEGGIRQLSQGLASGALRGDELNSVLENLPVVADVISKSLGVTRGELRALGAEGKISAGIVLDAFKQAREEWEDSFAKIAPTAADGFVLLKNQLIETVGAIDQAVGGSSSLGGALQYVTGLLKDITPELVNFVRALTGTLDPMDELSDAGKVFATIFAVIGSVLSSVVKTITTVVIGSFKLLGNAIGATAAIIDDIAHGRFSEAASTYKEAWLDGLNGLVDGSQKLYGTLVDDTSGMFGKLDQIYNKGARTLQDRKPLEVGTVSDVKGVNNTKTGLSEKELEKQARALEKLKNQLTSVLNEIAPLEGAQLELAKAQDTLSKAREKGLITTEQEAQYLELLRRHYIDILDPLGKMNREIEQQISLARMSVRDREIEGQMISATQELLEKGVILTEAESKALRDKLTLLQQTNEQTAMQDQLLANSVEQRKAYVDQLTAINALLADPNSGFKSTDATAALAAASPELFDGTQEMIDLQIEQFQYMYDQIDMMRQANLISEQTAQQMIAKVQAQQFDFRLKDVQSFFGNLSSLSRSENSKLAKVGQAAALAQATIDAASAIMKTYSSTPYPYNIALAAGQAAASAVQIANIAGANTAFQTGGSFTVGGSGGTDSQMVAFRATPGEKVAVSNQNQLRKGDPAGQGGGQGSNVQVAGPTIINVRDPKEIPNAIQSSDGRDAIINVFSDNVNLFKQMLQSS